VVVLDIGNVVVSGDELVLAVEVKVLGLSVD